MRQSTSRGFRSLMLAIFDSIDSKTAWHDAQGAEANADGELWQVVNWYRAVSNTLLCRN
jgi:hypothetical protein